MEEINIQSAPFGVIIVSFNGNIKIIEVESELKICYRREDVYENSRFITRGLFVRST